MARNDVVNSDGSLNIDRLGQNVDDIRDHTSELADIAINVKKYGAIGDGVADDSIAIQDAINYLSGLGGGTLLFPDGIYLCKSRVIAESGIIYSGTGFQSVIKKGADGIIAFDVPSTSSNIKIENLRFDGNKVNLPSSASVLVIRGANVVVENCWTHDNAPNGIHIEPSATNVIVKNCVSYNNTYHGIASIGGGTGKNIYFINNRCYDNGGYGIDIHGEYRYAYDNWLVNNTTGAMKFQAYSAEPLTNVEWIGNHCEGSIFVIGPSSTKKNIKINNNYVINANIELFDSPENVELIGNIIESGFISVPAGKRIKVLNNNILATGKAQGIYFQSVTDGEIEGNDVSGATGSGIYVRSNNKRIKVLRNRSYNNNTGNSADNGGIFIGNADYLSSSILIQGNILYDDQATPTQKYAIRIYANVQDLQIIGNDVIGCQSKIGSMSSPTITIKDNIGYVLENEDSATLNSGSASVVVTHGLAKTPSSVIVTPAGNVGNIWVSNITSTQLTINVETAPGSNITLYWKAKAKV
jgi:hypothetical protein